MERRNFLKVAASTAGAIVVGRRTALAQQADSHIEILVDEPIATIAPEIYGHFTEHIGSVIYDGIYVGEGSKIPNQNGLRSALIEKMRAIKAPVIRWPGGCFADSYDWRDGIGPKNKTAATHQFLGGSIPCRDPESEPPADLRAERVRHRRLCALLQAVRRGALPRRQCAQPDSAGLRPLGGVLQLAARDHHTG